MSLDIATARGQVSLADEQHVADWFNAKPGFRYIQTPKDRPAKVDAILTRNGEVMGLAETKCRYNLTLEQFQRMFQNEWLITAEKVDFLSRPKSAENENPELVDRDDEIPF